jgi:hypothetical protein
MKVQRIEMASESKRKHRPSHQEPGLLWRGGLAVARHGLALGAGGSTPLHARESYEYTVGVDPSD